MVIRRRGRAGTTTPASPPGDAVRRLLGSVIVLHPAPAATGLVVDGLVLLLVAGAMVVHRRAAR
jgi:hypothetical protein